MKQLTIDPKIIQAGEALSNKGFPQRHVLTAAFEKQLEKMSNEDVAEYYFQVPDYVNSIVSFLLENEDKEHIKAKIVRMLVAMHQTSLIYRNQINNL